MQANPFPSRSAVAPGRRFALTPRVQGRLLGLGLLSLLRLSDGGAVTPAPEEFTQCQEWADAAFGDAQRGPRPHLKLLYQDVADGMARGRSWRGTPFQLGEKVYAHGLAFNSTKHLLVTLNQPGDRFIADVGLENNDDTQRGAATGNGSVTFHVLVAGQEVFTTPVLRLKDGPTHLDVPLNGAFEFELRVRDGGDGRGWDQALWGEGVVQLAGGTKLRLQDLPLGNAAAYNPAVVSWVSKGESSTNLLKQWQRRARRLASDSTRERREVTYADPASGLQVRIEVERFKDLPAVEWVAFVTNAAPTDSPRFEQLQALDLALGLPQSSGLILHWAKGGVASFDDFAPQDTPLKAGAKLRLQPGGGRSSSQVLPFFNLEGAGAGVVLGLGWTGEWAAEFAVDAQGVAFVKAGLERTRLVLRPGEQIRTPRMLMLFYQGDRWRGQNLWRQFVLAHHRPFRHGQPLVAPITCGNWGGTRAEVHLDNIRQIIAQDLPLEYYWIDAEWYGQSGAGGSWPVNVGNWTVKPDLYPAGFKPLSNALRKAGRELMLWFEPERVFKGTPWQQAHRDWLFDRGGENFLFNLGHPQARQFLTEFISARIDEFGLGCYRQDFNIDPLPFWRAADAPDRQGMSEIRHIEGLYAFWDALLAKHPGLIIDNCASGGRRLDLETLGRATPFWRTDGPRDPIAHQCHTFGLLPWVPLSATSQDRAGDDYEFRSSMCSALCLNWWVSGDVPAERIPANFPFAWAKRTLAQYLQIRAFYEGDFYPLTSYTQAADAWLAYQLDRPDRGEGLVVALRRPQSPYESARFKLHGLEAEKTYQVRDLDAGTQISCPGQDLAAAGLRVAIAAKPGSALLVYRRE
jgi:alpha-galactosidase